MNGVVIDEDGVPQQWWTAVYWRYHQQYEETFGSFVGALRFLMNGEDEGELSSYAILSPDGETLMDKAALRDAYIHGADVEAMSVKLTTPRAITGGEVSTS